jgi:hypothetical protein
LAALAAVLAVQWLGATPAEAAELDIVAVVPSPADEQVTVVADVRPPVHAPVRPEDFSVKVGGSPVLPTRAVRVFSDQLATGLVVDASGPGGAALQAGLSGAANFLLQTPAGTSTAVVADTTPPAVVSPLRSGATDALLALSAVEPRGGRSTTDALSLVVRELTAAPAGPRLVVLYTSAPDAGGEAAADLAERLAGADALLAVVTTGADKRYWSQVTGATGGILVAAQPSAVIAAFDQVAEALRARYLVTLLTPGQLPARVSVRVATAAGTLTADAIVPAARPAGTPGDDGTDLGWLLVLGIGFVTIVAAAGTLFLARRIQIP